MTLTASRAADVNAGTDVAPGNKVPGQITLFDDCTVVIFAIWVVLEDGRKLLAWLGAYGHEEVGRETNAVLHGYPHMLLPYPVQSSSRPDRACRRGDDYYEQCTPLCHRSPATAGRGEFSRYDVVVRSNGATGVVILIRCNRVSE